MKRFYQFTVINFLLVLFSAASAYAVKSGNMLERFELIPDKQTPLLSFEGYFDPSLFSQIQIVPGNKKTETSVILPKTFINNIFFTEPEITSFAEEGILEKLSIEEKIKLTNSGEIDSSVILNIATIVNYKIEFDADKSDSNQIIFSMQKLKKMLISTIEKEEMIAKEETVSQDEADVIFWSVFTPRMVNKREKILLHPVTALMSYRNFDQLNVAILNASLKPNGAHRMAEMLTKRHKLAIEKKMGAKLNIVNISSVREQEILPKTKIYFHANLLKQAIKLAQVLPGEQLLEPIPTARASKLATDVEIFVGKNFE
tara:strand:- start:1884 stop:2828 length:945 start_codon:yes stop_codon:yes gene_type:complete